MASCAVGPDYVKPAPPVAATYTREPLSSAPGAQRFDTQSEVSPQWWSAFGSDKLNALVAQAQKNNPTIDVALASLRAAQANVEAQRGLFFPTVQAQFSPSRQRNAVGTLAPTLANNVPVYTLYTAQLAVSYAPDVWGLNRRTVESLETQTAIQKAQLRAAALTLATNVVAAVFQRATVEAEIDATQKIIAAQQEALGRFQRQLAVGYAGGLDVAGQEAVLAQAEATLPPLQKQLETTRDLLSTLIQNDPSQPIEDITLDELRLPEHLPLSLPSHLVEQRPDVQAAEEALHGATAQLGMATADLLPQIAITAAYGGTSTTVPTLFRPDNIFWSLVGSATQTVFDGGTLLAKRRGAEAGVDEALATYKLTVAQAMQNVADTLYALHTDAPAMQAALDAERAAKTSLDLTQKQINAGYANRLLLLAAQQTYQQAVLNRLQARGAWLGDTALLFQALGGGWWNSDGQAVAANGRLDGRAALAAPGAD